MSAISPPGRQQSLTKAIAAAQSAAKGEHEAPEPEPLPPAAPAQWLVSASVTAAIDAGLFRTDWTDCGHEDIWMESGSCMACEPAWQTPAERESREELDIRRQPGGFA